ncbi:MAG: hypothetical protein V1839_02895 [archaeon]
MESSEKDLQRRVEDISWWERNIAGIKGLTPAQQKEFYLASHFFEKALLAAMQDQHNKLRLCLNTAKEHEANSGVDFSSTYAKIKEYTSENITYS